MIIANTNGEYISLESYEGDRLNVRGSEATIEDVPCLLTIITANDFAIVIKTDIE